MTITDPDTRFGDDEDESFVEPVGFIDLVKHYLTCPISPARFTGPASPELTLAFIVSGWHVDEFLDLVKELGWEVADSSELDEEAWGGGWARFTITHRRRRLRRDEPHRTYAIGYRAENGWVHKGERSDTTENLETAVGWAHEANATGWGPFIVVYRDAVMWREAPVQWREVVLGANNAG